MLEAELLTMLEADPLTFIADFLLEADPLSIPECVLLTFLEPDPMTILEVGLLTMLDRR